MAQILGLTLDAVHEFKRETMTRMIMAFCDSMNRYYWPQDQGAESTEESELMVLTTREDLLRLLLKLSNDKSKARAFGGLVAKDRMIRIFQFISKMVLECASVGARPVADRNITLVSADSAPTMTLADDKHDEDEFGAYNSPAKSQRGLLKVATATSPIQQYSTPKQTHKVNHAPIFPMPEFDDNNAEYDDVLITKTKTVPKIKITEKTFASLHQKSRQDSINRNKPEYNTEKPKEKVHKKVRHKYPSDSSDSSSSSSSNSNHGSDSDRRDRRKSSRKRHRSKGKYNSTFEEPILRNNFRPVKLDPHLKELHGKPGEEIEEWFKSICNFVEYNSIPNNKIVGTVYSLIRSYAHQILEKIKSEHEDDPTTVWYEFRRYMMAQTKTKDVQDRLRRQLREFKHGNEDITVYAAKFLSVANRIRGLPEEELLFQFGEGLKADAKWKLTEKSPKTLTEAIELVTAFEHMRESVAKSSHHNEQNYKVNYAVQFPKKPNYSKHEINKYPNQKPYANLNSNKTDSNAQHNNNYNNYNKNKPGQGNKVNFNKNSNFQKSTIDYKNVTCNICGRQGHTANKCFRKEKIKKVNQVEELAKRVEKVLTCGKSTSILRVDGFVDNIKLKLCFDSGATTSIISSRVVEAHGITIVPSDIKVKVANNEITAVVGVTKPMIVNINRHICKIEFLIMDHDDHDVLLGLDWFGATGAGLIPAQRQLKFPSETVYLESESQTDLENEKEIDEDCCFAESEPISEYDDLGWPSPVDESLNNIKNSRNFDKFQSLKFEAVVHLTAAQRIKYEKLMNGFKRVVAFDESDLAVCKVLSHTIRVLDVPPVNKPPYRRSPAELQKLMDLANQLYKDGVIEKSDSVWASPAFLVKKPDGSYRLVIDFRLLNAVTITETWPLPKIDEILTRLSGSLIFSTLDLTAGYYQMLLDLLCRHFTAFVIGNQKWQYKRMPLGLKNAPAVFMRMMTKIFGDLEFVEIYIDDLTVHSLTIELHFLHLEVVNDRLEAAGLRIKPSKCVWFSLEVKVLGFIVSGKTVRMDPSKVEAITRRLRPTNKKEVQIYNGITGYYRGFIKNYSDIVKPLVELTKDGVEFIWNKECQVAMDTFTQLFTKPPILRQPDFTQHFYLHTDASGFALGACLAQKDDQKEYAICFWSRLLKGAELHYSTTEKECLGVVYGVEKCRHYIWGVRFTVVTDHSALTWLFTIKDPSSRLVRWSLRLQAFEFDIVHRKGILHSNVDTLSRPVLANQLSIQHDPEEDVSSKSLDLYEDETLLYYLRFKKNVAGISKKQVKRVQNLAAHYERVLENNNEIFYYKKNKNDSNKQMKYLVVPHFFQRSEIIMNNHKLGHFQAEITLKRIQERFYWKNMKQEVEQAVKNCDGCIHEHKIKHYNHPAIANRVTGIWDKIAMDLSFGLPEVDGYVGILNICEYLSGFIYTVPIKSKTGIEIYDHIWTYICHYGPPKIILTDQGNEFNNELVNYLLQKIQVHHQLTSAYNPRVDGKVERYNYLVIESLRKCMDQEPDKSKWLQFLSFVTLAFNSKVHSRTNFTPYELVFGRKINTFESWQPQPELSDIENLTNRSLEIKKMVEEDHVNALESIKQNQVNQRKQQDKHQLVQEKRLEVGTQVYVKTMGIQSKLANKYKGPFTIIEVTTNGNYILENELKEVMYDRYPLSRLKVIEKVSDIENEEEIFHIDKILKHRAKNNDFEYLVKWKNYSNKHNSWEPKTSFLEMDAITNYWKKINATTKKTKSKTDFSSMLISLILFIFLLPCCIASPPRNSYIQVFDNFKYCETPNAFTGRIFDVDHNCLVSEFSNTPSFLSVNQTVKNVNVLSKITHQVKGDAWHCSKDLITVETFVNPFFVRWINKTVQSIKLDSEDCQKLLWTKRCDNNLMTCGENGCEYDGTPDVPYWYLNYRYGSGTSCKTFHRTIMAPTLDTKLFGTNCTGRDLECYVDNTIAVWRPSILFKCPYELINRIENVTIDNNIIFDPKTLLAFELTAKEKFEEECTFSVYSSKENLFLTFSNNTQNLPEYQGDVKAMQEMILAEFDGENFRDFKQTIMTKNKLCENFRNSLVALKSKNNEFVKIHDYNGNDLIFYVDHGIVLIPDCVDVYSVSINNQFVPCEHPQVLFDNKTAYLDTALIISHKKHKPICDDKYTFFPKQAMFLYFNDTKYFLYNKTHVEVASPMKIRSQTETFNHDKVLTASEVTDKINKDGNGKNYEFQDKIVNNNDAGENVVDVLGRNLYSLGSKVKDTVTSGVNQLYTTFKVLCFIVTIFSILFIIYGIFRFIMKARMAGSSRILMSELLKRNQNLPEADLMV